MFNAIAALKFVSFFEKVSVSRANGLHVVGLTLRGKGRV
jgi:hypothetical protein